MLSDQNEWCERMVFFFFLSLSNKNYLTCCVKKERTCTFQSSLIDDECPFLCVWLRSGHLQRANEWSVSLSLNQQIFWRFFFCCCMCVYVYVSLMPRGLFSFHIPVSSLTKFLEFFVCYSINNFNFCLTIWFHI